MPERTPGLDPELLALHSVAVARVDERGRLIEASEGFRRLLPPGLGENSGVSIFPVFIQPSLATLLALPSSQGAPAYSGLLTLGDRTAEARTLRGEVRREPQGITVIAEHDVDELQRLYDTSLALTRDLTEAQRELARANRRILEVSMTDPLTGLANRRRLDQHLEAEIGRARRYDGPFSLVMCDIDHFKEINDRFGHRAGDHVLAGIANTLRARARSSDLVARYGGEEFVVVLAQTAGPEAAAFAERLRSELAQTEYRDVGTGITASFGVAEWRTDEDDERILQRADEALYRAKCQGRDRVATDAD